MMGLIFLLKYYSSNYEHSSSCMGIPGESTWHKHSKYLVLCYSIKKSFQCDKRCKMT